ncbi:hypothetical protein CI610_03599 [invertebrate metagenome]|uniref:Retrotransposon gag domain-containing protein n=1 Tax=invertebrate metagenome TaxID=1711999 RepID=A0A2H9T2N1_9ZZZZ
MDHGNSGGLPRVHRKQKDPQQFDGSGDFNDYILHFEQVALWNQWGNYEKAQQLAMSLRGPAQKVLSTLTLAQVGDYGKLRDVLAAQFDPPGRETAYRCQLKHRTHSQKESLVSYGRELRRLAGLAFPGMAADSSEVHVIDQFIHGLSNIDMKRHVQFHHPSSLEAAITLAIEFEAFDKELRAPEKKPRAYVDEVDQGHIQVVQENSPSTNRQNTELATMLCEGFETLGKQLVNAVRGGGNRRGRGSPKGQGRNQGQDRGQGQDRN